MPDAWDDDDWITKTESKTSTETNATSNIKASKAERRRQQAEFNKQIWERENNETPENNFFLQSKGIVPVKSDFKPQMVLSRRPAKPAESNGVPSVSNLEDDEDEDDTSKSTLTPEQRREQAQQKREEKQKAYDERRRQLFGDESGPKTSKPTSKTGSPRNQSRVKINSGSRPSSAIGDKTKQLFDPNDSTKPESLRPQHRGPANEGSQPVREPKAPDGSGRGGHGFLPRGGRNG